MCMDEGDATWMRAWNEERGAGRRAKRDEPENCDQIFSRMASFAYLSNVFAAELPETHCSAAI